MAGVMDFAELGSSGGFMNFTNDTISSDLLCSENMTFTMFGHVVPIPRAPGGYIALAVCHMVLILLPSLILSPLAIYFIILRSLSKHPTNVVFCWICMVCVLGPVSYGLLMDLSLILDQPLLGRCDRRWERMIPWLCYACATTTYDFLLAFSAITFYVSLRYNIRHFDMRKLNLALACVVVISFVVASFWLFIAESQSIGSCKIRGSFCVAFFGGKKTAAITLEVIRVGCALIPLNASMVVSLVLYYRRVKQSVVEFDGVVMGSIIRLIVVLGCGSLLWNGPTLIMHFGSFDGTQRGFIEMLSTFTLQQNFTLFPLLTLSLHKQVRDPLIAGIRFLMPKRKPRRATNQEQDSIKLEEVRRPSTTLASNVTLAEL